MNKLFWIGVAVISFVGVMYLFHGKTCASYKYRGSNTDICIRIPIWKQALFDSTGFNVYRTNLDYCKQFDENECKTKPLCNSTYGYGHKCDTEYGCTADVAKGEVYLGCLGRF